MLDVAPLPARCAARVTALPDHTHRRAQAESSPAQAALSPRSWTYHVPKIIGKAVHTQRHPTACRGQLSPIICTFQGTSPNGLFHGDRPAYSKHAVRWQGWIHVQTSKHSAVHRAKPKQTLQCPEHLYLGQLSRHARQQISTRQSQVKSNGQCSGATVKSPLWLVRIRL